MSTPRSRARRIAGALVGGCSAVLTVAAHAAAGGGLPRGAQLVCALLVCALAGGALTRFGSVGERSRPGQLVAALLLAQLAGHATLGWAAGPHHPGPHPAGLGVTPAMLAAHLAAAVLLGLLIGAAEYLYVVGTSVLCWLRLFTFGAPRPQPRQRRRSPVDVVVQSVLRSRGLGMRASPSIAA